MTVIAAGSIQIKHLLPTATRGKYDTSIVLDNKKIEELVDLLVREDPEKAHETLADLSRLFFNTATQEGFSLSLDDYENNSSMRQELIHHLEQDVRKILSGNKSKLEKSQAINAIVEKTKNQLSKQNMTHLLTRGATSAKMAATGARGNPGQLMQASASPLLGADSAGNPVPIVIRNSYSEGLSIAEAAALSFGSRQNTIQTQRSTSLPGEIFKKLTPNLFHEVITEHDCGTKLGTKLPVSDTKAILHKYEAVTNKLFTDSLLNDRILDGAKTVIIRTPISCEAPRGICQLCYGLMMDNKLPEIGTNVGVLASQSVSEKLTQAVLSTKHTGGLAGKQRNTYEEASNFLKNPENFQDKAILAPVTGKVESVVTTPLNDHLIHVTGYKKPLFVPREQDVIVKSGQEVKAGDPMSTGTANPREFIQHFGISKTREFFSKKLRDIYNGSEENSRKRGALDTRHFDVISRNMIKYVKIDHPGETGLLAGDVIPVDSLRRSLKGDLETKTPHQAIGQVLAESVGSIRAGDKITERTAEILNEEGVKHVKITASGLSVSPIVPGVFRAKFFDKNWMSRLSTMNLKENIQEAAARAEESPTHSTDPITSYLIGREFGHGPKPGDY